MRISLQRIARRSEQDVTLAGGKDLFEGGSAGWAKEARALKSECRRTWELTSNPFCVFCVAFALLCSSGSRAPHDAGAVTEGKEKRGNSKPCIPALRTRMITVSLCHQHHSSQRRLLLSAGPSAFLSEHDKAHIGSVNLFSHALLLAASRATPCNLHLSELVSLRRIRPFLASGSARSTTEVKHY